MQGTSRGRRDELVQLGKALAARLFILIKTSQNYPPGHGALDSPAADVLQVAAALATAGHEAVLRVKGHSLYVGEVRLKPDTSGFASFNFLIQELGRYGISAIALAGTATAQDLLRFVYLLRDLEFNEGADRYTEILERMQALLIAGVEVEALPEEAPKIPIDRLQLRLEGLKARILYRRAAQTVQEELADLAAGKKLRLRDAKRVVQQMIDLMARDEASFLGLCTPNREWGTRSHAANVCILALCLGRRLGLAKFTLCELGLAALLHDIGFGALPEELVDRDPALFPEEQRQQLEAHPLAGVRRILESHVLDRLTSRIVTGVFEHHLLADFSGYPRFPYQRLGLFGRIISIADRYDWLITLPQANGAPFAPEKALRYLLSQAGKGYDAPLLKLFIGCVGVHPVGSLLQLDTRELAVVVGNHADPERLGEPKVRVIADASGKEVDGALIDLAAHGSPGIAGTLDPQLHQIDVSRYLLAG